MANGFQATAGSSLNDRQGYPVTGDFEYAMDPASSMIFSSDSQKNDDLKKMLDGTKDGFKLAAMKRIINMVARGKDCSDLFPAVVKNVVSKNAEVKKLVYVYLTRYAEEQQDLALLSIATFQRSLKDANQLIRACALRVLSSIRVPVIVPVLMLAIRDGAADLSPYVRKTVAHAIPKLYSLDPDEKESLVEIINRLLDDKSTLVAGSAIEAFEEVCPERLDLIHRHFRKLCNLLMDVEEWGQVVIINMLTRYARTQFPNPAAKAADFTRVEREMMKAVPGLSHTPEGTTGASEYLISNDEDDDDVSSNAENAAASKSKIGITVMGSADDDGVLKEDDESDLRTESCSSTDEEDASDASHEAQDTGMPDSSATASAILLDMLRTDYRLLISSSRLLLLNRNSAVVLAVAQLFYYCAPKQEMPTVVRALIRILHSTREVQHIVLANIATISLTYPRLFDPHLRCFFVFNSDSSQSKLLKLEILTNLVTEATSPMILREFQSYVNNADKEFVATTIQCIGRCASVVPQIAETCLTGLVHLMSRKDERLVAESVVVMRKLLQMQTSDHKDIIIHIAQMVDEINIPSARASILWLLGEYSQRVPRTGPDVLRKMAKTFAIEDVTVKLQILNLAAKLCIYNPRQTQLLAQYVFTLAKYDQNYDIRDRSRFFRALIVPTIAGSTSGDKQIDAPHSCSYLNRNAKKILLATKPAPVLYSKLHERPEFQLGSMSHMLGRRAPGYQDLPDWPLVPPDPTTRQVNLPPSANRQQANNDFKSFDCDRQPAGDECTWRPGGPSTGSPELLSPPSEEEDDDEEFDPSQNEDDNEEEIFERNLEGRLNGSDASSSSDSESSHHRRRQPTSSGGHLIRDRTKGHSKQASLSSLETESSSDDDDRLKSRRLPTVKCKASAPKQKEDPVATLAPSVDLLLLDFDAPAQPISKVSASQPPVYLPPNSGVLTPILIPNSTAGAADTALSVGTAALPCGESRIELPFPPTHELVPAWFEVTPAFSEPLVVEARFVRTVSIFGPAQVCLELRLTNKCLAGSSLLRLHAVSQPSQTTGFGVNKAHCTEFFQEIPSLAFGMSTVVFLGVDFCDSTQPIRFSVAFEQEPIGGKIDDVTQSGRVEVSIQPPVGELFQPLTSLDEQAFVRRQGALRGMHEDIKVLTGVTCGESEAARCLRVVLQTTNLALVGTSLHRPSDDEVVAGALFTTANDTFLLRFAGQTVSSQIECLLEISVPAEACESQLLTPSSARLRVNTEAISLGLQLAKQLVDQLSVKT